MINHKLKYTENTIEIEINWEKIILDKVQPITKLLNWRDSMDAIEELDWRKSIDYEILEKLDELFSFNPKIIWLERKINDFYWSNISYYKNINRHDLSWRKKKYMWVTFNFRDKTYDYWDKIWKTICIHS